MAESVVNFAVETIGRVLIEEAIFLHGVTDQVELLKLDLIILQALLKDADARQNDHEMIKVLVSWTRDLAYEAEDLIERYAFKIASQKENIFRRSVCILNECAIRHSIGSEIQCLQSKIARLTTSFQAYGIRYITEREDPRSSSRQQLRRTYSHIVEDDFIKLDNDVERLVGHLVNDNEADFHGVVSICGMGGLGKTTIARKVYNHPKVQGHFEKLAWVCISQQWKKREILQGILCKFSPTQSDEIVKCTDDQLMGKLFETVQNTKCLVVLDDIWSTDVWDCIREAFPIAKNGSKLLLTTRKRSVALHIGPNGFHHEPRLLSDKESWELLQLKALRGRTYMGPKEMHEMERLGKGMVKHCGGLPLAVVVLGGILLNTRDINEWKSVHENVKAYIERGENLVGEEHKVQKILALSYKDLPQKLKPCFLYLGRFPEDSDIDVEKLCQLWLAEGMILIRDQIGEESMMDVAKRYLRELAKRSMVQVKVDEDFHKMKSCRLHDFMRDLTLEKAKEENLFLLVQSRNGFDDQVYESSSSTHQIHRLVIHLRKKDVCKYVPSQKRTTRHLRSLRLLVEDEYERRTMQTIMSQLSWFRMLRVLEIEVNHGFKLPEAVGNLIHLRYLAFVTTIGFRRLTTYFLRLPSSIGNLKHLQTLDLKTIDGIARIPDVLCKMRQLKYLHLPTHYSGASRLLRLKGLDKLEILKGFKSMVCSYKDLLKLTNLRQLQADLNYSDIAELVTFMSNSKYLTSVNLSIRFPPNVLLSKDEYTEIVRKLFSCNNLLKLSMYGPISNFPNNETCNFASSLVSLTLLDLQLRDDPTETVERLPNLRYLYLGRYSFVGIEMQCGATGFPQLRRLHLCQLENLVKWTIVEGSMPNLSSLEIEKCKKLEMIPDGLRYLTTLKNLEIIEMPKEFESRVRLIDGQEGEDCHKIRHVPLIKVRQWWDDLDQHSSSSGWVCRTKVAVPTGLVVEGLLAFSKEEEKSG